MLFSETGSQYPPFTVWQRRSATLPPMVWPWESLASLSAVGQPSWTRSCTGQKEPGMFLRAYRHDFEGVLMCSWQADAGPCQSLIPWTTCGSFTPKGKSPWRSWGVLSNCNISLIMAKKNFAAQKVLDKHNQASVQEGSWIWRPACLHQAVRNGRSPPWNDQGGVPGDKDGPIHKTPQAINNLL